MAGKGGGAWKVAYADFVTAMMAFFMVMWLTSQKPEVKQAVAGYFRDPYAIFKGNESGAAADATPTEDPKLGHEAESQRRHVSNSGNDSNYQFAVLFDTGVAELDAANKEKIRSFAPTMVGKLNRVEVRAHCQSVPLPEGSPFQDRWDLCYARGRAVQAELETHGIDAFRMRISLAEANEPLAANLSTEELKLNSRVDIILLDDLVAAPWQNPVAVDDEHGEHGAGHGKDGGHEAAADPGEHAEEHGTATEPHGDDAAGEEAHEAGGDGHATEPAAEDHGDAAPADNHAAPADDHGGH
jgi:chemotaxis protein MotB